MRRTLAISAFIALCAAPRLGHAFGAAGAYASPYLKMPMGVRTTAMGEAFTGLANDVNAIYYNPAGLTSMDHGQVELMHLENFGGIRYENLSLGLPAEALGLDFWGSIGFSYTLVSVEDMLRTRIQAGTADTYDQAYADRGFYFTSGASVIDLSYAWQATKAYSLGGNLKVLNEKVDTVAGWGFALDLAAHTRALLIPGLSAGMVVQNIGSSPTNAPLPMSMRLGLGHNWKHPFTGEEDADGLQTGVDFVLPIVPVDGVYHMNLGTEYVRWFAQTFVALRVGYRMPTDLGALAGLTAGGGLGTQIEGAQVDIDYAYVPYGDLGVSHRMGLSLHFGPKVRKVKPSATGKLVAPLSVQATGGDMKVQISWAEAKVRADGYNVYMTYDPTGGKWYKLNRSPLQGTAQTINKMHNGYPIHLAISSVRKKSDGTLEESPRSDSVRVVPQAAGGVGAASEPAASAEEKPREKPKEKAKEKAKEKTKAEPKPSAKPTAMPAPPLP